MMTKVQEPPGALITHWKLLKQALHSENARIYYWSMGLVALWRTGLEILNQAIVPLMAPGPDTQDPLALKSGLHGVMRWVNAWDGAWYRTITEHGYVIMHNFQSNESVAFFPLFPYAVRWLSEITRIPFQDIGLTLNLLVTSLLVFFIFKFTLLVATEEGSKNPRKLAYLASLLLLLNPSAFFFAAYYADAILVCLIVGAIYAAYKNEYVLAALLAGLSTAAKSIGVVALPAILLIYLARHKGSILQQIHRDWVKLIALSIISLNGVIMYMFYLWVHFGQPLAFLKVEKYWNRSISGFFLSEIWQIWYQKLDHPSYYRPVSNFAYDLFLMLIPIAVGAFCAYLLARHRMKYAWLAALSFLTILIPLSTGTLLSLNRYVLLLTPAIAYILVYFYDRSAWGRRLVLVSTYFSAIALVTFTLVFLSFRFAG